jgi:hypothetical protein
VVEVWYVDHGERIWWSIPCESSDLNLERVWSRETDGDRDLAAPQCYLAFFEL